MDVATVCALNNWFRWIDDVKKETSHPAGVLTLLVVAEHEIDEHVAIRLACKVGLPSYTVQRGDKRAS